MGSGTFRGATRSEPAFVCAVNANRGREGLFNQTGKARKNALHREPALAIPLAARAPVAQLDRVPDYGSGGWGFESSRARHFFSLNDHPLVEQEVRTVFYPTRGYSGFHPVFISCASCLLACSSLACSARARNLEVSFIWKAVGPLIPEDAVWHANATLGSDVLEIPGSNDDTVLTRSRSSAPIKIPAATNTTGNPNIHLPKMPLECRIQDASRVPDAVRRVRGQHETASLFRLSHERYRRDVEAS